RSSPFSLTHAFKPSTIKENLNTQTLAEGVTMTDQQQLSQDTINEFVIAAHSDLEKVQRMLAEEPALLNENADWIETAIQGAAHVNNRPIIDYLIAQGAPIDICTAAVLGQRDEVAALLAESPELARATGPHNLPVMFY